MQTSRHDHPRDATDRHDAERVLTELDHVRLSKLLERAGAGNDLAPADSLLDQAEVVPPTAIGPGIVTMNSRVRCRNLETGDERELTLVYPCSCTPERGHVSVLSRAGIDLLSASPGDSLPRFELATWHVVELVYQPEAEGHYHL